MSGAANTPTVAFDSSIAFDQQSSPYNVPVSVLLTGTETSSAAILNLEIYDGAQDLGHAILGTKGNWSLNVDLAPGPHRFTAVASDINGPAATAASAYSLVTGVSNPNYVTEEFDTDGSGHATGEKDYDANGTLRRQTVIGGNGILTSEKTFGKTGSPVGQSTYDSDGKPTYQTTFDALGNVISTTLYDSDGNIGDRKTYDATHSLTSETVENGRNSYLITGSTAQVVLNSVANDIMTGGGSQTTYHFTNGFGHDEITNFVVTGTTHDIVDLPGAQLKNVAAVLRHTTMASDGSAVIHLDHDNAIKLDGITKAELIANQADFRFHA